MTKLLLLSASSYKDTGYLIHAREFVKDFLKENGCENEEVLFIPYAGVRRSEEAYEKKAQEGLNKKNITSIHRFEDKKRAINEAKVILVGGGNSFMLLHKLYENDLLETLAKRVREGACYIGWSAGSNIAGKTIKTTNDMPIIMPKSFDSLGVFKHQINPHFISGKIPGHNGESREERLEEFLIANPNDIVYAIPEGSMLKVYGDKAEVLGYAPVLKMSKNMQIEELKINTSYQL